METKPQLAIVIFLIGMRMSFAENLKVCEQFNISQLAPGEKCNPQQYYDHRKQLCLTCRRCKQGFGVHCPCSPLKNTYCTKCPSGTFSKLSDEGRFCWSCSTCKDTELLKSACNATHDAACVRNDHDNNKQGENKLVIYKWIVGVLSGFVFVVFSIILVVWKCMKNRERENKNNDRTAVISIGSEASFNGSSFSSVNEPGMRRFKNSDRSTQSSLLSTDCSASERPQIEFRRLRKPEVLISTLPAIVYEDLGKLLNPKMRHRDWQTLAGHLKFDHNAISNIKLTPDHDFTERTLAAYTTKCPNATIGVLLQHLEKMQRMDAAGVLLDYDDRNGGVETPV